MPKLPVDRHPLEAVRIVEEGIFAEKKYQLAEHLRKYNVTQVEYRRLHKSYTSCQPLIFPTRESALDFVSGHYEDCMAAFFERQEKRSVDKSFLENFEFPSLNDDTDVPGPAAVVAPKKEEKAVGKRKRLDEETVQLIALDLLENPSVAPVAMARRWGISNPSLYRIKQGQHQALQPETKVKLEEMYSSKIPGAKTLADLKRLPLPQPPQEPQRKPEPQQQAPALAVDRQPVVSQPGIAPAHIGNTVNERGRSLKQVLQEAREIMEDQGVQHVSLPLEGPIKIQRVEILL